MSEESKVIKVYESFRLGFCKCGCNKEIPIKNRRGFLRQFDKGHNMIGKYNHARGKPNLKITGPLHPQWRGGEYKTKDGYTYIYAPWHPNSNPRGYVFKHILNMSIFLRRPLKKGEVVHHTIPVKKGGSDDISNLQLLESQAIHLSIHMTKDKSDRRCVKCGTDDSPNGKYQNWYVYNTGFQCRYCYSKEYEKTRRVRKKKNNLYLN